jgi:hypothetical protein
VFLELTWTPFIKPGGAAGAGASPAGTSAAVAAANNTAIQPHDKVRACVCVCVCVWCRQQWGRWRAGAVCLQADLTHTCTCACACA